MIIILVGIKGKGDILLITSLMMMVTLRSLLVTCFVVPLAGRLVTLGKFRLSLSFNLVMLAMMLRYRISHGSPLATVRRYKITVTLQLPSDKWTWMRKYNYTPPVLQCIADGSNRSQPNEQILVSKDSVIECFLSLTSAPIRSNDCLFSCTSAALRVSVFYGKVASLFDFDMYRDNTGYRRKLFVSNLSYADQTLSTIKVLTKCLQPMALNWTDVEAVYVFSVIAPTSDSHRTGVSTLHLCLSVACSVFLLVVLAFVFYIFYLKQCRINRGTGAIEWEAHVSCLRLTHVST